MESDSVISSGSISRRPAEKSKTKKRTVIAVAVSAVVCGVVIVTVVLSCALKPVKDRNKMERYANAKKVCQTANCNAAAEYIKSNMNLSADPCNDFFNYVCGGWVEKNKDDNTWQRSMYFSVQEQINNDLQESLMSNEPSRSKALTQAKKLYQACIQMDLSEEKRGFMKVLRKIRGFPLYVRGPYDKRFKWYQRLGIMYREFARIKKYSLHTFSWWSIFMISIQLKTIQLHPPLEHPIMSAETVRSSQYKDLVYKSVCDSMEPSCNPKESVIVQNQIEEMTDFLSKLTELTSRPKNTGKVTPQHLNTFDSSFPDFHMPEFLKMLFSHVNVTVNSNTEVYVYDDQYFEELGTLINKTKPDTINNVIGWAIIENFPYRFATWKKYTGSFLNIGPGQQDDLRKWCFEQTHYIFPFVLSRLFVDKSFDVETKNIFVAQTEQMRKVFVSAINNNTWLDADDKKDLIHKLNVLNIKIGFPRWIKIDRFLDEFHSTKKYLKTETVMENLSRFYASNNNAYLKRLVESPAMHEFFPWIDSPPYEVNAVNTLGMNLVTFNLAQYYSPLYWPKTIKALEYSGSAMSVMGHEVAHTIDDKGITYDATGKDRELNENLSRKFKERVKCFTDQYSSIVDPVTEMELNGKKTSGEDISDNVAIRLVFDTYVQNGPEDVRLPGLEKISDKQLLLISSSMHRCTCTTPKMLKHQIQNDEHTMDKYRIIMPAVNFPEFSQVFNCGKETYMNSKPRCRMW